jgi:hypothetical protein
MKWIRFSNPCQIGYVPTSSATYSLDALYKIGTAPPKTACNLLNQKVWLPGMGSNHELDRFLKSRNLLILNSREKPQKQAPGTKSVQNFFDAEKPLRGIYPVFWVLFLNQVIRPTTWPKPW